VGCKEEDDDKKTSSGHSMTAYSGKPRAISHIWSWISGGRRGKQVKDGSAMGNRLRIACRPCRFRKATKDTLLAREFPVSARAFTPLPHMKDDSPPLCSSTALNTCLVDECQRSNKEVKLRVTRLAPTRALVIAPKHARGPGAALMSVPPGICYKRRGFYRGGQ
jgi:hypothetical protein